MWSGVGRRKTGSDGGTTVGASSKVAWQEGADLENVQRRTCDVSKRAQRRNRRGWQFSVSVDGGGMFQKQDGRGEYMTYVSLEAGARMRKP